MAPDTAASILFRGVGEAYLKYNVKCYITQVVIYFVGFFIVFSLIYGDRVTLSAFGNC